MKRVQSPSSINTFIQCPRKYHYIYHEKLPTSPSIHLVRGSIAHEALEHFFDIVPDKENFRGNCQQRILLLFNEYWQRADFSKLDLSPEKLKNYHDETQLMLINWVNQFVNKLDKFMRIGLSYDEAYSLLMPEREVLYQDKDLMVRGYIDTVENIDGQVRLMDYKTSKTPKMTDAYLLQLGIYALLYKKKHGTPPHKVGVYFLKDTEHLLTVDEELMKNAYVTLQEVHAHTERYDDIDDYPMKTSPLCKWRTGKCDFYDYCFKDKKILKKESQTRL